MGDPWSTALPAVAHMLHHAGWACHSCMGSPCWWDCFLHCSILALPWVIPEARWLLLLGWILASSLGTGCLLGGSDLPGGLQAPCGWVLGYQLTWSFCPVCAMRGWPLSRLRTFISLVIFSPWLWGFIPGLCPL